MKLPIPTPKTLRERMGLALSLLLLAAAAIAIFIVATQTARSQLEVHKRLGQSLISLMRPVVQRLAVEFDTTELRNYMNTLASDPAIAGIRVTDNQGFVLYKTTGNAEDAGWLTRMLAPGTETPQTLTTNITLSGSPQGKMEVTLSYKPLNDRVNESVINSLIFFAVVLVISVILVYSLLTRFTAPLQSLTELAREYSRGNWVPNVRLIESGSKEIQELNQAFADGSAAMQHYIHTLEETRELLEHSESRLRSLINGMHEVLFELDRDGRVSFLNPAWQTITGLSIDETLGKSFTDFLSDDKTAAMFAPDRLSNLQTKNQEILLKTMDANPLWVTLDADAKFDANGNFAGVIGTLGDITESIELNRMLRKYQKELYHLSVTDPLTGLYNRRHFDTEFDIILSDHLQQKRPLCLLLIDIDGFKFINDTYGHPFGDEVLKMVADLLKQLVRKNDYMARLAGDEFAMVLKNTDLEAATRIAYKLHDNINQAQIPLPVGHIQIQSSIGVAEAPTHGEKAQELISAADVALYQGKRAGRNRVQVLSPDISKATMSIFSQGFQLRNALEGDKINPAFQPICNLQNSVPVAYEVLARMRLDKDVVPAKQFITVAEELGLTREIDLHVIEQALITAPKEWNLFLNVDLSSFNDSIFIRQLRDLLTPARESGRSITIEITERESVPITDEVREDIQNLRDLGCKLALDDFGSGYSTYNFLDILKPDYLKIEGTFVQNMLTSESAHKIVIHIHELAASFGMETIAENIENEATYTALREIGICNGQGIYFGSPEFLKKQTPGIKTRKRLKKSKNTLKTEEKEDYPTIFIKRKGAKSQRKRK